MTKPPAKGKSSEIVAKDKTAVSNIAANSQNAGQEVEVAEEPAKQTLNKDADTGGIQTLAASNSYRQEPGKTNETPNRSHVTKVSGA